LTVLCLNLTIEALPIAATASHRVYVVGGDLKTDNVIFYNKIEGNPLGWARFELTERGGKGDAGIWGVGGSGSGGRRASGLTVGKDCRVGEPRGVAEVASVVHDNDLGKQLGR